MRIEDVLARRSDLSTFLVHLTKRDRENEDAARNTLDTILREETLRAINPFGALVDVLRENGLDTESQNCVCFTETPLEHINLLVEEIEGRNIEFAPYGLAFTRLQGRRDRVNPVWYMDGTPDGRDFLINKVGRIARREINEDGIRHQEIFELAPFFEYMGITGSGVRKEFWWEREWRKNGNINLRTLRPFIVLSPSEDFDHFREIIDDDWLDVKFVDPYWSLERIIGNLAGFSEDDLGPL